MTKLSRIGTVNSSFRNRILPEIKCWGLGEHPNPMACYGRDEHGYRYDFADVGDVTNVRLATFHIFQRDTTFWIAGHKGQPLGSAPSELHLLYGTTEGVFILSPRFSLCRLFDPGFRLRSRQGESLDAAAERLMDEIEGRLPLLKRYLYG